MQNMTIRFIDHVKRLPVGVHYRWVTARFAKRDNEDGDAPDWGAFKPVQLRIEVFPISPHKTSARSTKFLISVQDFNWAEYTEYDFSPEFNEFETENWRMQLTETGGHPCSTF